MRNEQGKFVKGTSGNPLGRPRIILTVRDIAREHTEEAIETLAAIMRDEVAPAAARISASDISAMRLGTMRPLVKSFTRP